MSNQKSRIDKKPSEKYLASPIKYLYKIPNYFEKLHIAQSIEKSKSLLGCTVNKLYSFVNIGVSCRKIKASGTFRKVLDDFSVRKVWGFPPSSWDYNLKAYQVTNFYEILRTFKELNFFQHLNETEIRSSGQKYTGYRILQIK